MDTKAVLFARVYEIDRFSSKNKSVTTLKTIFGSSKYQTESLTISSRLSNPYDCTSASRVPRCSTITSLLLITQRYTASIALVGKIRRLRNICSSGENNATKWEKHKGNEVPRRFSRVSDKQNARIKRKEDSPFWGIAWVTCLKQRQQFNSPAFALVTYPAPPRIQGSVRQAFSRTCLFNWSLLVSIVIAAFSRVQMRRR